MKLFKFPEIIKQYEESLKRDLRHRKSIDSMLDYWLPSEDLYLSINSFLESILLNTDIINLKFACSFKKDFFDKKKILEEINKFKKNYDFSFEEKKKELIFNFIIKDDNVVYDEGLKKYFNEKEFKPTVNKNINLNSELNQYDFKNFNYIKKDFDFHNLNKTINFNKEIIYETIKLRMYFEEDILKDASIIDLNQKKQEVVFLFQKIINFSIGKPFREISNHACSSILNEIIKEDAELNKQGIITIKNPNFKILDNINSLLLNLLKDFYKKINLVDDYKNLNEFFLPPPEKWLNSNENEKKNKISIIIKNYLDTKNSNLSINDIEILGIKNNIYNLPVRIVIRFSNKILHSKKPKIMREIEDCINKFYNYNFDCIVEMYKDKSVLRRELEI